MCLRLNWARRPLDPVTECTGNDKDLLGASCRRRSSTAVTAIAVVGTVMRWQWCVVVDVCIDTISHVAVTRGGALGGERARSG